MADGRLTALQAALAGIGGGVTSAQKYGETRRLEAERKRMFDEERARQARLDERQRELDRIGMLDKGYMTPEQAGAERQAGGAALSRALASASGMLAGRGAPAFGQGIGAGDGTAIVRGMGQVGPQQRATLGGQTFVRAEPESARMRMEELKAGRERMGEERKQAQARTEKQAAFNEQVDALVATGRIKRPDAEAAVRAGARYSDLFVSPSQEKDFALKARQIAIAERNAAQGGTGGQPGGAAKKPGATDKLSLQATLPNVIAYAESFAKMTPEQVRKMSPDRMDARSTAMATEGVGGLALRYGQSKIEQTRLTPAEERYIAMSNAVADAVSRATDIGVQSNFDIKRFRDQVKPLAGDSPDEMEAKLRIVKGWANWLISHKKTIEEYDAAYEAGKPLPTITLQGPTELDGVSEEEATGSPAATQGMATPRAPSAAPAAIPGVAPLRTQVRPMGTQVQPVRSAPSAARNLPLGVDAEKYRTDPAYRAFVDRGSR